MRQIVSLIRDNQAHFALVDEETNEMIPFADLLLPDPDRFGMHEAALLGTNLINVLGLNGVKRPKIKVARVGDVQLGDGEMEQLALVTPEPVETPQERKRRQQRESYHRNRGSDSRRDDLKAKAYIPMSAVVDAVNKHGQNGLTSRQIAEIIAATPDDVRWVGRTIDNRITAMRAAAERGVPMPVRIEYDENVKHNGMPSRKLYPL